ncbi:spore germination protein [Bacillus tamaricis]|uniref:Spore germination protein n=1 Tax=Evansella tamaricis TaxID=2069301 RepID=A0ABS6JJG4_9BACI|nr:spore germination protein [Evansella tamaricis]MBU9712595.1 spore germination protein [Evansella tamaricis]
MLWKWFRNRILNTTTTPQQNPTKEVPNKENVTLESIKTKLKDIDDAQQKELTINGEKVVLIYISALVQTGTLQDLIFTPLNQMEGKLPPEHVLKNSSIADLQDLQVLINDIMSGYTVLYFLEREFVLKVNTYSVNERSITAPESETTVLGPQDSLTEAINTSLSLIKRRIRSANLKTKIFQMGTETNDTVAVLYMDHIANEENVQRVLHRVKNIEYQGFVGMPIFKQMLEDKPFSPFPQHGISVRTDYTTEALLDGRVIVMVDGSPEAAILPATFFEMFTTTEDFYNRWTTASLLRVIRLGGFLVSILLTSTYVSVLTYHPEMLPPTLLLMLSESRTQVPFPPVLEVLIIEMVIEILREAGARMPTKIGQTIGIVGGIVIGTAAVEAGLSSNVLIVLVAVSALLSFLPPNYLMSNAIRLVRYGFIIAGGLLGMYGQIIFFAWLMNHLSNLTSLGSPYMTPFIPRQWTDLFNSVFRAPINFIVTRSGMSRAKKQLTRPLDEE